MPRSRLITHHRRNRSALIVKHRKQHTKILLSKHRGMSKKQFLASRRINVSRKKPRAVKVRVTKMKMTRYRSALARQLRTALEAKQGL